jgi:hypothetical protein
MSVATDLRVWEAAAAEFEAVGVAENIRAWQPQPKQALADRLAARTDELLYGGAAGGGKTEWLIHHVLDELLRHPGNRGAIFRRVKPSLKRTIVPRVEAAVEQLGGKLNQTTLTATLPNGSVLEMAGLQYEGDVNAYSGAEYGVVAFEEVTEFLQSQWEFLIGRLRAPVDGVRPHAVATTNPGGVGHRWVKRRFVKPEQVDVPEGETIPASFDVWRPRPTEENPEPLRRCFVPSTLSDNPKLTERDPGYLARLRANSNRGLRKALETGDWDAIDAIEGALWEQWWLDGWRVDQAVPSDRRVVAVDPSDAKASGDGYGLCVASRGYDGRGYVEESHEWRNVSIAKLIDDTVAIFHRTLADAIIVERNHGGAWLVEAFRGRHPNIKIDTVWASDGKRTRAEPVSVLFEPVEGNDPRAVLVGNHPELEEQMTTTKFTQKEPSPNLIDACVWAMSDLLVDSQFLEPASPLIVNTPIQPQFAQHRNGDQSRVMVIGR